MNPIDALFERLRASNQRAFMPFVTAGDPDLETTGLLLEQLAERGASLRFWFGEHRRVAGGESCGEEWIVLARRPAETRPSVGANE